MNSQYGSLGASMGYLPCKAAAAAVTATGRQMILDTKAFVEDKYGGEVIYGDSVAGSTPVVVNGPTGFVEVLRIEDLCHRWALSPDGTEYGRLPDCSVWTELGWTEVLAATRHRVTKPMFRVTTCTGVLDVTEDHSLLDRDGCPLKPLDTRPG
ncbi:MAG: hypothetical protein EOO40_06590, partial [Deltaproteobacteria bacterium]